MRFASLFAVMLVASVCVAADPSTVEAAKARAAACITITSVTGCQSAECVAAKSRADKAIEAAKDKPAAVLPKPPALSPTSSSVIHVAPAAQITAVPCQNGQCQVPPAVIRSRR